MRPLVPIFVIAMIAGSPGLAAANSILKVQPSGKDGFLLSGEGLEGFTSGDILLQYEADDGGVAEVVVTSGLGTLAGLSASSSSPGVVNFTLKTSRSLRDGSGPMAQIKLKGRITHLSGWLQNEKGEGEQPTTEIINSDAAPKPVSPSSKKDAPVPHHATAVLRRIESALDRFRALGGKDFEHTGPLAGQVLTCEKCGFSQDPPILLSNGYAAARVSIKSKHETSEVPNFVIAGGKCTRFQQGDSGEWLLEIVPDRGALMTSVTLMTSLEMIEYPLAVAPPLAVFDAAVAEQAVERFVRWANQAAIKFE